MSSINFQVVSIEKNATLIRRKDNEEKRFGSFSPWEQSERAGRNPRTGIPCVIRKRISVKFKPGKDLLDILNQEKRKYI